MMGRQDDGQGEFLYHFHLDDFVPKDHLLRQIDRFLDFGELREQLKPFYSHTGRPSIDPELMLRMLIIGYCYGIRCERRLCEEVQLNLAYRWFCHLSDLSPLGGKISRGGASIRRVPFQSYLLLGVDDRMRSG